MANVLLEVKNLTKVYGELHALDGINLQIFEGEVMSLIGVNGAGKTTLSSILATLHPATSGDVLYRGKSIYSSLAKYRKILGFCPQKPNLDSYLNVKENLVFAGRYFLMTQKESEKRANKLLEQFDLVKYQNFNVNTLSGGNKQRLVIARSLMHKPKVIILDEPTVGLDPDIRRQLWAIIKGLKEFGVTVILTTHYLDEAEVLSDRVCFIHNGKVILTETMDTLKQVNDSDSLEDIFIKLIQ